MGKGKEHAERGAELGGSGRKLCSLGRGHQSPHQGTGGRRLSSSIHQSLDVGDPQRRGPGLGRGGSPQRRAIPGEGVSSTAPVGEAAPCGTVAFFVF